MRFPGRPYCKSYLIVSFKEQRTTKSTQKRDFSDLEEWRPRANFLNECKEIQKRLLKDAKKEANIVNQKAFCRLMLQGKISSALKFVNNDADAASGVLPNTMRRLKSLIYA